MSLIQAARLQRLRALRSANLVAARSYATPVEFSEGTADPQLNGYPQLPVSSAQRLPAKGWWDVQDRRNFGDFVQNYPSMLLNYQLIGNHTSGP